jgi:Glycosyl hydrolase family 79 C-terminal beta domain/Cellulase (glycosyl hydrolase family 5)
MHSLKAFGPDRTGLESLPSIRNFGAALCAVAIAASSYLMLTSCSRTAPPVATVSVNTQQLGAQIPKDFLGFSNEVSTSGMGLPTPTSQARGNISPPSDAPADAQIAYVLGDPGAPNTGFFTMMKNLGPGVLRLGGNSQDTNCWDPAAAPHPKWCEGTLTPGLLKLYSTAVEAAGWRMILGLNLKQNSARWALREATEGIAKQIPDNQIIGLEIGNEPSLFPDTGARPKSYSPADYVKEARAYIRAFRANPIAGKYNFVSPANCCGWNTPQALGTILKGIGSDLKLASVHNYTTTTCHQKNVTAAELLSPERMKEFNDLSRQMVAVARENNLPIALAETNSASCGGMAGVSNAFTSAVWGLDYMFNMANDGYAGVDFHFSYRAGGSAYNPVQAFSWKTGNEEHFRNVAQPLYYAMYMFAQRASGEHLLPASITTQANITAFATTACPTCEVHVFVINKDEKASGRVTVHLAGRTGAGTLVMLEAPSLGSMAEDVRYGGQQFDTDGHIGTPSSTSVAAGGNGDYTFTLPNASAAVLSVAP